MGREIDKAVDSGHSEITSSSPPATSEELISTWHPTHAQVKTPNWGPGLAWRLTRTSQCSREYLAQLQKLV